MLTTYTLLLFLISFGASALGGILGMASGIFIVPLLTLFCNLDIQTAITASLISVIACSCAGAGAYLKAKLTNFRLAMILEISTTLGALTGVLLMGTISNTFLSFLFCATLFISAFQMFLKRKETVVSTASPESWGERLALGGEYVDSHQGAVRYSVHNLPLGMFLMYLAGVLSALLGIGSGVLKIPAMDSALRLPIKVSSATSNFMIGVTAAASAGAYFIKGAIVPEITGPVVVGSVVGALVGAKILISTSSEKLRMSFVLILIVFGVQMLFKTFKGL
ncbi:sulfite exporter TauE/SafE family protein [Peredibacter sp. HCB2-198]|uniref:sulfite exporter TauE/SafE family protein n=1 Tax=Peredibacter sp. HCB2-198 TaxID=3383025 RepID=UPI0038B47497